MGEKKNNLLFNIIAPIYGLFYHSQRNRFAKIVENVKNEIDLSRFDSVIDIGCGTGALCSVLNGQGIAVIGIDPAEKMLEIAISKPENQNIKFIKANVLERLPFDDKSFDIAFSSYVAHGLKASDRKRMYAEMNRIAKEYVIIHDYNDKRSLLTSLIEWLEGGDYFHFIKNAKSEMESCFSNVRIINVDVRANWYICKPIK